MLSASTLLHRRDYVFHKPIPDAGLQRYQKNRIKREVEKSLTDSDVEALRFVLPRLRFLALPRFHRIVMRNRLRCTECSRWCGFRENQVLLFCCCSCFGFRFFEELLCGCSCCVCCCCFRVLKKKLCRAVVVVIVFFCFWEEFLLCCVSLELTEKRLLWKFLLDFIKRVTVN